MPLSVKWHVIWLRAGVENHMLVNWFLAAAISVQSPLFHIDELTIDIIHAGLASGQFSCRELVQMYIDRIETYDQKGPALNAIVRINRKGLERADAIDRQISRDGITRRLECVPMIVKDNYDTADMPTTAGSLALAESFPVDDAFQVARIREAGAIVLAKSNMAEYAFTAFETLSSIRPGHTRNPYDIHRVPAGSSGGTAAAVAANFGAVGLGTDTGNSIRGPSSHTALVGIRSTMGVTSRDGIVPLNLYRDIGGPMARTVKDAVTVFDVIAGYDPSDAVTEAVKDRRPRSYSSLLTKNGLRNVRIGVVRQISDRDTADPAILALFERSLEDMERHGATIIDPVVIPSLDDDERGEVWCNPFKGQINAYLAGLGPGAPVRNLVEIIESGKFHPSIRGRLESAQEVELSVKELCRGAEANAHKLRDEVKAVIVQNELAALVYPSWSNPPRLLGDLNTPHGNNSPILSPPTGFPSVTVPMGFIGGQLPAGLQFLGKAFSEVTLFKLAYAYEQATRHRRPPSNMPPLW